LPICGALFCHSLYLVDICAVLFAECHVSHNFALEYNFIEINFVAYFNCCRQLPSLMSLETLHMRDTQRTLNNIPGSMDSLTNLTELDLAQNALPKVPDALYSLRNLRRLNLSDNEITELSQAIGTYHSHTDLLNLCMCVLYYKNNKKCGVFATKSCRKYACYFCSVCLTSCNNWGLLRKLCITYIH
jgi:hypothetical protein